MKFTRLGLAFGILVPVVVSLPFAEPAMAADLSNLVETCAACHGKDGVSTDPEVPTIAGLSPGYFEYNLAVYQKKERPCPEVKFGSGPNKGKKTDMCEVAKGLNDSDVAQVGKFFAGKKFIKANQPSDSTLAKKGKAIHDKNCEKCHANSGTEAKDDAGVLAGQWTNYLRKTFQEYKAGKRHMEQKMKPRIQELDEADIEALLNYYASVK